MRNAILAAAIVLLSGLSAGAEDLYKARCVPNLVKGMTAGYKCTDIGKGSKYERAGLQNGDILLSVDSVKIDGPKAAMTLIEDIEKERCKEIVISRDGNELTLNPKFE